ncbi:MAG: DUF5684 domain-containing protein [Candidatus Omnitrophota bacterium]
MKNVRIILLLAFLICVISSFDFAESSRTDSPYLCVSGIVSDVRFPLAMINDQILEEGETILGAKIVKIGQKTVEFEYEGRVFIKEVGQDCLKVIDQTQDIVFLGKEEGLNDRLKNLIKFPTSREIKSTEDLKGMEKQLAAYFQKNSFLIVSVILLILILSYLYYSITLQTIAIKTGTESAWLAWVPIASLYLECKIAGKPWWWLLLRIFSNLVPFVGPVISIIISIIIWIGIANARRKPSWLGILTVVPLFNIFLLGYLAFSKSDDDEAKKKAKEGDVTIDIGTTKQYRA